MSVTSVKEFHYAQAGAPILNSSGPNLLAGVLDACLVTGWGLATVDSIVISGGVATVTKAGHPFRADSVALIAGAVTTGGLINGEQRVLSVPTSSTYTFAATGMPDQAATGTITHKVAPAGWGKPFASGNVHVYRSASAEGTQCCLRVDDSVGTVARVVGYKSMSDVNTGTLAFPGESLTPGGGYWGKSSSVSGISCSWRVIADERAFYLWVNTGAGPRIYAFGDFISEADPAPWDCVLVAPATDSAAQNQSYWCLGTADMAITSSESYATTVPCGSDGSGSAARLIRWPTLHLLEGSTAHRMSGLAGSMPYPNPVGNRIYISDYSLFNSGGVLRGRFAGAYWVPQLLAAAVATDLKFRATLSNVGRSMVCWMGTGGSVLVLDVTGPWR